MIAFASSLDQAGPLTRDVTDAALLFGHMVGHDPLRLDLAGLPGGGRACRPPSGWTACASASRRSSPARASSPACWAAFEAALDARRALGATVDRVALPHADHGLSAYYVLAPAEASSEPGPLRRRPLRAARRRRRPAAMYTRTRHDGFGPEVKRRIMLGTYALSSGYYDAYYGRAQRVRTKIAERLPRRVRARRPRGDPDEPGRGLRARREDRRPAGDVPQRLLHRADVAGRDPRDLDPRRPQRGPPVGLQLAGPAFSENRVLDAAFALERALGFDGSPARATA